MAPTQVFRGEERRAHPRHDRRLPLTIQPAGGEPVAAQSIDVSVTGMRVRSASRMPTGACDIVLVADPDDRLIVQGTVLEEVLDASTGEVTARIVFDSGAGGVIEQLAVRTDPETFAARRRGFAVLAAGLAIVVAGVVALVLASADEPATDRAATATPTTEATGDPSPAAAPTAPAATPPAPEPSVATTVAPPAPTASPPAPAPTPRAAATPRPAAAPSPSPTPAAAPMHTESADNAVSVILGSSSDDTAVSSSMGPSDGVDEVRVQLHVTPEPEGTALPVAVTVENRGTESLRFPDGLQAEITATRDGAVAATTTLVDPTITEVAPGERVLVEGTLDFGATGQYEVVAQVDVSDSSA